MNLNKISVKQQGGQMIPNQPGMQQQPQVHPAIQQVSVFFKESIDKGGKPEEVVMGLMQQEVDQNTIVQALMSLGYQENDLQVLFQNIQEQQQPADPTAQQINQDPQQLARQQEIQEDQQGLNVNIEPIEMAKSGIEIKPENEGKFTAWAKARGMSVQEAARKVMANKDRYPTRIVKMANFAKNAAGWKKEEGGEQKKFEPHFMYKGDRKIRAKDMETHLRLKEAGYTHDAPKAQTGNEMIDSAYEFANKNNTTVKDLEGNILYGGQDVVNDKDDGLVQNPFYISPSAFHSGKRFSPASLVNSVMDFGTTLFSGQDKDNDGLKDGSLRDLKNKTIANKAQKYADADYTLNLDLGEENINNFKNWLTQYQKENPTVEGAISNLPTPNIKTNKSEINTTVDNVVEQGKDWLNKNISGLSTTAQGVYDALKKKIGSEDSKQFGGSSLNSNMFNIEDIVQNQLQTDYMADTQVVADAQLQQRFPGLGDTPLESETKVNNQQLLADAELDADSLFDKVDFGSVDVDTGGVFGALKRGYNSNAMRAFEDISGKGIGIISNINDFMEDADDSGYVDARENIIADNAYATKTDPQFKKGKGPDINTGLFGSDADRVTGYYMKNGGTNNPGFKALPKSVQANILQNMQDGGNPFNPLKLFTGNLEEYQQKGETPTRSRKSRSEIESEILELQNQIETENSRIEDFQSNIDKIYRGFLTSKEADSDELRQSQLNKILENSSINPNLFNVTTDAYGDAVVGLDSIPSATRNWLQSRTDSGQAGYGCTSYGCGILRQAGATTEEGKPFPIISGNSQLNSMIERNEGGLGMQLMEPGFSDLKPGDRVVSNYSTSGGSGAAHTMIFTGDYDENGSPIMMENTGGRVGSGVNYRPLSSIKGYNDTSDPDSGLRVTRYVGSSNDLNNQLSALQSQLDNKDYFVEPIKVSKLEPSPIALPEIQVPRGELLLRNDYGGEKGEAAYLANRDKVIKREMAKAQQGGETINVDSKMLAKLIAAGADIEML